MDELIKLRAADTLLSKGVRVTTIRTPFWLKLLGVPKIRVTLFQPTIAELVEMSSLITLMGLDGKKLQQIDLADSYSLVNGSAYLALGCLIIAMRFKHPLISRKRLIKILATNLTPSQFKQAWKLLLLHSGVADFIDTTRWMITLNYLNPQTQRSGQAEQSE